MHLGGAVGVAAEQHTNKISEGRVVTIDTCSEIIPHEDTVNAQLLDCLEEGVPGGNKIGKQLEEGDRIEYVDAFRASQVNEASNNDWDNVLLYGIGGLVVGAIFTDGPAGFRKYTRDSERASRASR